MDGIDTKSLKSALESAILYLRKRGVPDADIDAGRLLEETCDVTRSTIFVHPERPLTKEQADLFVRRVILRGERVPPQQILGTAWFYGYPFYVTDQVLCPRYDTEVLVEEAIKDIKTRPEGGKLLDLCTGSGCILTAILLECETWTGTGTDLSGSALLVAAKNTERLGSRAKLIHSDLFSDVTGTYSVLVSNPPYIRSDVIGDLMEEVRDHEPHMALDGGRDGLDFYRGILDQAPEYLEDGAGIFLEIGYDQSDALTELMTRKGYSKIRIVKDLSGLPRVACAVFYKKTFNHLPPAF